MKSNQKLLLFSSSINGKWGESVKKILIALIAVLLLLSISLPAFAEGSITVDERNFYFFINNGKLGVWDRVTYQNPQGESLKVIIPKDATDVTGGTVKGAIQLTKDNPRQVADGLEITIPLPKGNDLVELQYMLKPNGNIYNFATKVDYPIKNMVFSSSGDIAVTGPQIAQGQPKKSGSMNLVLFTVTNPVAGQLIQANVDINPGSLNPQQGQASGQQNAAAQQNTSGQQGQSQQINKNDPLATAYTPTFHNPGHIRLWKTSVFSAVNPHVFTAFLIALPILFIVYFIRQRRKEKLLENIDVDEIAFQKLYKKQHDLLQKIAELDDRKQNSEIDEEEYTTLRENYKHRVLQIKAHLLKLSE